MLFCNSSTIADIRKWDRSIPRDIDTYTVYKYVCPILLFFCLLSVTFNSVLLGIGHFRQKRDKTPILVLSLDLACTDTIASLINGIGLLCNSYLPIMFDIQFTTCTLLVIEIFRVGSLVASVLHLLALAIVHYRGAVRPLHYRSSIFFSQHLSRSVHVMSFLCWLLPLTVMSIYFSSIPCQGFQSSNCGFFFMLEWKYRATVLTMFAVPLAIMVIIYLKIFIIITKHHRARQHNNHHHTGTLTSGQIATANVNLTGIGEATTNSLRGSQKTNRNSNQYQLSDNDNADGRVSNNYNNRLQITNSHSSCDTQTNTNNEGNNNLLTSENSNSSNSSQIEIKISSEGRKSSNEGTTTDNSQNNNNNNNRPKITSRIRNSLLKQAHLNRHCSVKNNGEQSSISTDNFMSGIGRNDGSDSFNNSNNSNNLTTIQSSCKSNDQTQLTNVKHKSVSLKSSLVDRYTVYNNNNSNDHSDVTTTISNLLTPSETKLKKTVSYSIGQPTVKQSTITTALGQDTRRKQLSNIVFKTNSNSDDDDDSNRNNIRHEIIIPSVNKCQSMIGIEKLSASIVSQQTNMRDESTNDEPTNKADCIDLMNNLTTVTTNSPEYIQQVVESSNRHQNNNGHNKQQRNNKSISSTGSGERSSSRSGSSSSSGGGSSSGSCRVKQQYDIVDVDTSKIRENLPFLVDNEKHLQPDATTTSEINGPNLNNDNDNQCWFIKIFDNLFLFRRPTSRGETNKELPTQKKHCLPRIKINRDSKRASDIDVTLDSHVEKERLTSGVVCHIKQLLNEQMTTEHQLNQHAAVIKLTGDSNQSTDNDYVMRAHHDLGEQIETITDINNNQQQQLLYSGKNEKDIDQFDHHQSMINSDTTTNTNTNTDHDNYIGNNNHGRSLIIIENSNNSNNPTNNRLIKANEQMKKCLLAGLSVNEEDDANDNDDDICCSQEANNNSNNNNNDTSYSKATGDNNNNGCDKSVNNRLLLSKQNSSISATFISNHSYQSTPNNSSHRRPYNSINQRRYERKKRSKQTTNSPGSTPGNTKALVTTLLILGTYIIFYAPAIVYLGLTCIDFCPFPLFDLKFSIRVTMGLLTNGLIIMKTIVDPFIYSYRMKEIQDAINMFLTKRGQRAPFRDRGSLTMSQRFTTLTRQSTYYAATNRHFNTDSSFKAINNNPNSGLNHLPPNASRNNSCGAPRVGSTYLNQTLKHQQQQQQPFQPQNTNNP